MRIRPTSAAAFEIAGDADNMTIRNNQEHLSSGNVRLTADMEIVVPKGATIEAHGRNGDFDITDVNGNVEIISDNAGVRLQNLGGDARIDLRRSDVIRAANVKGSVDVKGTGSDIDLSGIEGQVTINGTYSGVIQFRNLAKSVRYKGPQTELSFEKLPGQVRFALGDFTASGLVGPTTMSTRSKDVQISDFTNSLEISVQRGDIELRPGRVPLSRIDVTTKSGDIELSIPRKCEIRPERGHVARRCDQRLRLAAAHGEREPRRGGERIDQWRPECHGPHRPRPGGGAQSVGRRQAHDVEGRAQKRGPRAGERAEED